MRHVFAVVLALLSLLALPVSAQPTRYLISAQPMTDTPPGTQAWRVQYWTTNGSGQRFAVTGIVAAPMEAIPPRPRRVIAWTHGAWGVAEKCAPSLSPNFFQYSAGMNAVRSGYVVVAPDYIGLASPAMHPFLVGPDTANAVLDAVRAHAAFIRGETLARRLEVGAQAPAPDLEQQVNIDGHGVVVGVQRYQDGRDGVGPQPWTSNE